MNLALLINIVVTDDFNLFAPHLFDQGLDWAYQVQAGALQIIGTASTRAAAWQQARAVKRRLMISGRGNLPGQYSKEAAIPYG